MTPQIFKKEMDKILFEYCVELEMQDHDLRSEAEMAVWKNNGQGSWLVVSQHNRKI